MGHWFVDTAGIGSIIVMVVGISVLVAYFRMLRWIQTTPRPVLVKTPAAEESQPGGAKE